ncbi:hypothetical protein [Pontibacter liquoris]|uniref:hypothetical protein n=1 Tax=Pontibacter liquoris TaxID=2905677 RepID=UPI001FA7DAFA|nr:hypothetical protein [Pontibacter liquoris]
MNLSTLRSNAKQILFNIPGWHTNRKIVVIESDDWGSIRMPSKEVYDKLLKAGVRVDNCAYNRVDSLASCDDLTLLFELLNSVKDKNNRGAVITANTIVANPDFEKIKNSDFQEYHYEPFVETLKKYSRHSDIFQLWKQGMKDEVFKPQFHGREHVNVDRWMNALRAGLTETHLAFNYNLFGISNSITKERRKDFMPALDYDSLEEKTNKEEILIEGMNLFRSIFGYTSSSFIAPSYVWSSSNEETLSNIGVKFMQSNPFQKHPLVGKSKYKRILHYTGQSNNFNQKYLVRNTYFEPTLMGRKSAVENCLSGIDVAFRWKKPAIIGSHRLNYIGSIDSKNRDENLKLFKSLLSSIVSRWPDVEFMSSDELGNLMA